jgi:hypothetical protein
MVASRWQTLVEEGQQPEHFFVLLEGEIIVDNGPGIPPENHSL